MSSIASITIYLDYEGDFYSDKKQAVDIFKKQCITPHKIFNQSQKQ